MAHGGNMVLDKGFKVLTTYNASDADGVEQYRVVKFGAGDTIDLQSASAAAAGFVGVVQENIDRTKVATGKAVANVRMMGITKVRVAVAAGITQGGRVMAGGAAGTAGGVINAATAGSSVLGINLSPVAGLAAGDLIDVLLTPGVLF